MAVKDKTRNYPQEKAAHKTSAYRKANATRKRARRSMERKGSVRKFDGKEVDHKKMMATGGSNSSGNLRVTSKSVNRRKQPKTKGRSKY